MINKLGYSGLLPKTLPSVEERVVVSHLTMYATIVLVG